MNLSITTLDGHESFVNGYYPLEDTVIQGICNISPHATISLHSLVLEFYGIITCMFTNDQNPYSHECFIKREFILDSILILSSETISNSHSIPFQFNIPNIKYYNQQTNYFPLAISPSFEYYPPSCNISGISTQFNYYQSQTKYYLRLQATENSFIPFIPKHTIYTIPISPFVVYDPRLIPFLLHPESKRAQSIPGCSTLEFDVFLGNSVFGPNDKLEFNYRMHVTPQASKKNIRIKRIILSIHEIHILGHVKYTPRAPDSQSESESESLHLIDREIKRLVKSQNPIEILHWESIEDIPETTLQDFELSEIVNMSLNKPSCTKSSGGDGIYAENHVMIDIPGLEAFAPSTCKYDIEDNYCFMDNFKMQTVKHPLLEVRHTLDIYVELKNAEKVKIAEWNVFLTSVATKDCLKILQEKEEIMPGLEYDRVMGGDVWVPEYLANETCDGTSLSIKFEVGTAANLNKRCLIETFSKDMVVSGIITSSEDTNSQLDILIKDDFKTTESSTASVYWSKQNLKSSQKFKFTTTTWYQPISFCFTNTKTPGAAESNSKRTISFKLSLATDASDEHLSKLTKDKLKPQEIELFRLNSILQEMFKEAEYLERKEQLLRDVNEATNERVRNFRLLSMISFCLVGGWQIWYLQKFFQQKKLI